MRITNINYFYGKSIIWRVYRDILRKEREEYRQQQDMIMRLGYELIDLEENSFKIQLATRIEEVFNSMPSEQRKLLYLRYCQNIKVKELALSYGVTPSALSHRITKARAMFRQLWEEGGAVD